MNLSSNEDILAAINRLFELLHQTDGSKGSIQLVYVAPGAQHVEHQQIYVGGDYDKQNEKHVMTQQKEADRSQMPDELSTKEAGDLWSKAREWGYVDRHNQPKVSRTQAALLANEMAERLGIRNKWKVFEAFWHRSNMYQDYYDALDQRQSLGFQDGLKRLFG